MEMATSRIGQSVNPHHPPPLATIERRHDAQPRLGTELVAAHGELRFEDQILEFGESRNLPRGLVRFRAGRCCEFYFLFGHVYFLLVVGSLESSSREAVSLSQKTDLSHPGGPPERESRAVLTLLFVQMVGLINRSKFESRFLMQCLSCRVFEHPNIARLGVHLPTSTHFQCR